MSIDQSTILPTRRGAPREQLKVPTLTIAWHPDISRVGETLVVNSPLEITRKGPDFAGKPLQDPHISRKPTLLSPEGTGIRIRPHPAGSSVRVNGAPGADTLLNQEALGQGVLIELAQRVLLLLHLAAPDAQADGLGMIGSGLDDVRRQVNQVADLDVAVLIRGETGTGKEHVARAIHHASNRRGRSFVAVNLGAIPASTAAAELFGHTKGAFTGADKARPGLFRQAAGGTLFLDEVGEAPPEVQVQLLRALETGEVMPLGSGKTTRVDVRVLAATDANLEEAIGKGGFREPLLHRLAGYEINLPPLRERAQDIGPLLAHFVKEELDAIGEGHRLTLAGPASEPWFPVELAAELIQAAWPGNVRQLRNIARQLVIASRGLAHVVHTPAVSRLLESSTHAAPQAPKARAASAEPADALPDDETIREALRKAEYKTAAAARALGISKTTLYAWMERTPGIRKAKDLEKADLDLAYGEVGGDRAAMARHLEVSKRGLTLRITELGWEA